MIRSIGGADYSYRYRLQPIVLIIGPITHMADVSVYSSNHRPIHNYTVTHKHTHTYTNIATPKKAPQRCFQLANETTNRTVFKSAKFDPEPNRLLQCRLCQLATTQHHSAPDSHQLCCSSGSASQEV